MKNLLLLLIPLFLLTGCSEPTSYRVVDHEISEKYKSISTCFNGCPSPVYIGWELYHKCEAECEDVYLNTP
jgi:uncharacterized protein YcfL